MVALPVTTWRRSKGREEDQDPAEDQPLHVASRLHAFSRFELKYLVPVEQAAEIRDELGERMDRDLTARSAATASGACPTTPRTHGSTGRRSRA